MGSTHTFTRRHAIRLIGAATLSAFSAMPFREDASAARGWCRADPVLRIGGQKAHVYITSTRAMLRSACDKIRLTVTIPDEVEGKLIDILSDFDEGYDVRFYSSSTMHVVDGRIPVRAAVYCPARDDTLPVSVEFAPVGDGPLSAGKADGAANSWIVLTTS
jgi:hypothetical protein